MKLLQDIYKYKKELEYNGVYKITNLVTNKFYIGSCSGKYFLIGRLQDHLNKLTNNKHYNKYLQKSFNKYGVKNFTFEILEYCSKDKCLITEQYYLDTLLFAQDFVNNKNNFFKNFGYNICPIAGSNLGFKKSKSSKKKMSTIMKGKKPTLFVRKRLIEVISKPILQYDLNGNFIKEWDSIISASRILNIKSSNICSCLKNKIRTSGGFIWKYKTENYQKEIKHILSYKNKSILQLDLNNNIIREWDSASDAVNKLKELKLTLRRIYACCKGKEKTHKKYKWKYKY